MRMRAISINGGVVAAIVLGVLFAVPAAYAEDPSTNTLDQWLAWVGQKARVLLDAAAAPDAAADDEPAVREELDAVQRELSALRSQMEQLQETLDLLIGKIMADLEKENEGLRRELRRAYALQDAGGPATAPRIPRPDQELMEEVLDEAPPEREAAIAPEALAEPVEFSYSIVQEWGRTPADVQRLGTGSSLKAMVVVVPAGSRREDLAQLGRDLRVQYGHYENINIEVFDGAEAAQQYYTDQVSDPAHHVLTVSKHRDTGRDVILLMQDGIIREIEF